MLTDPLAITYNSTAFSLVRGSGANLPGPTKQLSHTVYNSSDLVLRMDIIQSQLADRGTRAEILFSRTAPDPDGPYVGSYHLMPNRVGIVYEANNLRFETSTVIPLLRSALNSFVTTTIEGRVIAGES